MTPARWCFGDDPAAVCEMLSAGNVIAIPTESSYGLAADPANPEAVARVFAIKGRSDAKALPVVASDEDRLPAGAHLRPGLESRLAALWPAALTLVLDLDRPLAAAAGGRTLAVRVPAHEPLRSLLSITGPLTATSANRSGQAAAVTPEEIERGFRGSHAPALIVDGGKLAGGPPSTLLRVEANGWRMLRRGAVSEARIQAWLSGSSTAIVENSADG